MGLTTRLIETLAASAASLDAGLAERLGLRSIALVGSLARADFNCGGSNIDLLFVHSLGESADGPACPPELRPLQDHFSEPLRRLGRGTGLPQPLLLDCHCADMHTVSRQPHWADPAGFLREYLSRDRFLWIYAFDFVQHSLPLWGEDLRPCLRVHDPRDYLPILERPLRQQLARLQSQQPPADPPARLLNEWKDFAGQLMTLLALKYGLADLRKHAVHRSFNLRVPYFDGKDFAASLWAEYLYGSIFQDRAEWQRRCSRFCTGALGQLTRQNGD